MDQWSHDNVLSDCMLCCGVYVLSEDHQRDDTNEEGILYDVSVGGEA